MTLDSPGVHFTHHAGGAGAAEGIVALFQRGAVDGLNMIVPHGDKAYYDARPSIAIPRPTSRTADCAIDLDGFFGLHPRMAPLESLFKNGSLAIVHASGSHDETRSHFDAQDYMESGTPGVKSTRDGWLNRYLHNKEHESASRSVPWRSRLRYVRRRARRPHCYQRASQFWHRAGRNSDGVVHVEPEHAARLMPAPIFAGKDALRRARCPGGQPDSYAGRQRPSTGSDSATRCAIAQLIGSIPARGRVYRTGNWDHCINEGSYDGRIATRSMTPKALAAPTRDMGI